MRLINDHTVSEYQNIVSYVFSALNWTEIISQFHPKNYTQIESFSIIENHKIRNFREIRSSAHCTAHRQRLHVHFYIPFKSIATKCAYKLMFLCVQCMQDMIFVIPPSPEKKKIVERTNVMSCVWCCIMYYYYTKFDSSIYFYIPTQYLLLSILLDTKSYIRVQYI